MENIWKLYNKRNKKYLISLKHLKLATGRIKTIFIRKKKQIKSIAFKIMGFKEDILVYSINFNKIKGNIIIH